RALLGLDDPRRRDQLLGAGDLGDRLDRPDPRPDRSKRCCHGAYSPPVRLSGAAESAEAGGSAGRLYFATDSCSTSPAPSGVATSSSETSSFPPVTSKVRRNRSMASLSAATLSSGRSLVSLIDVSRPSLLRCRYSRNSA